MDLDKIWLHFWNKRRKTLILDPSNVEKVKNLKFPLFSWEFSDFKIDRFDFKSQKWSFLTKIFCFKSPKKVAHQISYGSTSLLNFLRANQSKKISPVSKVRTFGFELLTKIFGSLKHEKIFSTNLKKNYIFEISSQSRFQKCNFFRNQTKKIFKIFPTNTKTRVFDFCQKFKTKGTDLWNGGNFLSPIQPQKIQ